MLPLSTVVLLIITVGDFYMCLIADAAAAETSEENSPVSTKVSHFGPEASVRIASNSGTFRVNEGETITLTCTASCLPVCSFRWTCSGCVATRRADLTMVDIQRDQAGSYTCLAYNNVSRGRADVMLDVLFPAFVKHLHFADGKKKILQVPEGSSVSISCQATGNPPPQNITWSVSGQPKNNNTFKMRYRLAESSVLMLPSSSCNDNDIYTCATTNGQGTDSQSVQLQVLCPPTPPTEGCHHGNDTSRTLTFAGITNLTACVTARPKPNVTWYRVISDLEIQVLEDSYVVYNDVRATLETWISLNVEGEADSVYRVVIEGSGQSYVENYTVRSTEERFISSNVTVLDVTMTAFCVSWIPALSGNDNSAADLVTFLLTYSARSAGPFEGHNSTRSVSTPGNDDDVITHCVDGLRAGTVYDVVLSVDSEAGSGNTGIVAVFNVTTQSQAQNNGREKPPWREVGASFGVGCLLLVLVASLLAWKRRQAARSNRLDTRKKAETPPLCICNENVRLSYLEVARSQSSCYVDAASRSQGDDVSTGREHAGSGVDAGRLLGVDDLSRRPSSTPSANIYLDVLGDPATYINQADEGGCMHGQVDSDMYEIPVTTPPRSTGSGDNNKTAPRASQHYIDMNGGVASGAHRHSVNTEGYDIAWGVLPTCGRAAPDDLKCELCKKHMTTVANGESVSSRVTPTTPITGDTPADVAALAIVTTPSIVVSDETGRRRNYACDDTRPIEDEHVYDVIRDSDVED